MISPLVTVGLALVLGQVPEPVKEIAVKLKLSIVRSGYGRIGVIPRFFHGDGETASWDGPMGPQAEWLSDVLNEALAHESEGQFQVVDNRRMAESFRTLKVTLAGLSDRETLGKIGQSVGGLDALIIGRAVDVRESARPGESVGRLKMAAITCNLIELRSGDLVGSAQRELEISPCLAAYRGESAGKGIPGLFVIDRQGPDPKGTSSPLPGLPAPVAIDNRVEGPPPVAVAREIPALDDSRCPFEVQILVDEKPREFLHGVDPNSGRPELYVNLEPGESYRIAVRNRTGKTAFGAFFVDGINILGKKRDPENPRVWNLAPHKQFRLNGWYSMTNGSYSEAPFVVRPAGDSVAIREGGPESREFPEKIGEILCIFYDSEDDGSKSMMPGRFGSAAGKDHAIKLEEIWGARRRDDRLISYVIHYAPMSQIEKNRIVKE